MITFLGMLLLAAIIAKAGQFILEGVRADSAEVHKEIQDSKNRQIQFRAWLNGSDARAPKKGCIDGDHTPMVLFNQKDRTKVDEVICSSCTDKLPTPAKYTCGDCWVINVDGYLHVDVCPKHAEESQLAYGRS